LNGVTDVSSSGQIIVDAADSQAVMTLVLTPTSSTQGDIDLNCNVNVDDLLLVINEWGKSKSPADVNGDGIVDLLDS